MTEAQLIALLDPPKEAPSNPMFCVDVRLACGRYYLNVFGVTTAIEGDLCRDCRFLDRVWDHATLQLAAERIRKNLGFMASTLGMTA